MDELLQKLADFVGKRKGDLKKTANAVANKPENKQLKDIIPEEAYNRIILLGVCKRYEIDIDIVDEIMKKEELIEEFAETIEEIIGDDIEILEEYIKENEVNKKLTNWKDIFGSVSEKSEEVGEGGGFRKVENLDALTNILYKLRIEDPTEIPYEHHGIGRDGSTYTSHAINVVLVNTGEDGKRLTVNGVYKLWLNELGWKAFVRFWKFDAGLDAPDNREFDYKKAEKLSKNNRKYNIHTFK